MTDRRDEVDSGSDWDDSTLDFTSPRQQKKNPLRSPFHSAIIQDDESDEHDDNKPTPKERTLTGQRYDNGGGETTQKGSKMIPKQKSNGDQSSGRPQTHDSPPYDFKGALTDERKLEDTGQRPGRDRKGNLYDAPTKTPPVDRAGDAGSWDDSEAEERTLRELNATLKKEKRREHAERIRQQKQQQLEAERSQSQSVPVSQRGGRNYASGRHQQDLQRGQEWDNKRPYTARDIVLDMQTTPKLSEDPQDLLPVVFHDEEGARMLYNFKPCNMKAYEVPDTEEEAVMPAVADKAEKVMRRLWLEVFGSLRLVTSIFVIFITEALRFVFNHVFQPIVVGLLTGIGDYLLKPVLSLTFGLVIQPIVVFMWNVLTGVRHMSQPLIDILHGLLATVAMVLRSFRLFDVSYYNSPSRPVHNV